MILHGSSFAVYRCDEDRRDEPRGGRCQSGNPSWRWGAVVTMKRLCCFLTGLLFAITPVHAFNDGAPRTAYSTAYPYVRLFLSYPNTIPFGTAWAFTSADAVSELFGNTSREYAVAQDALAALILALRQFFLLVLCQGRGGAVFMGVI